MLFKNSLGLLILCLSCLCCDGWILHAQTLCKEMNENSARESNITIKYTIRNQFAEPWFEYEQNVTSKAGQPFIRFMEQAADDDKNFQFSSRHSSKHGYVVEELGKDMLAGTPGLTYWRFVKAPSTVLSLDVSRYIPEDGDHLILDFVM
ncbi:uncharacterized protein LOC133179136 [Saccostrea echinata]|uniref:uncharacterized protein LOC133179136 n=1 Tax=Saccostrea echinata TaxID=191078 RepID=UPI002A832469|nr:uncharacterized protein LOC133179136 [Saccostrea echinata]